MLYPQHQNADIAEGKAVETIQKYYKPSALKIPSPSFSHSFFIQRCVHFKHLHFLSSKTAYLQVEKLRLVRLHKISKHQPPGKKGRHTYAAPSGVFLSRGVTAIMISQKSFMFTKIVDEFCSVQFRHCYCPGLKPGSLFLVTQRRSQCSRPSSRCSRPSCRCSRPQRRRPLQ